MMRVAVMVYTPKDGKQLFSWYYSPRASLQMGSMQYDVPFYTISINPQQLFVPLDVEDNDKEQSTNSEIRSLALFENSHRTTYCEVGT
jgi:hypothetical protein